MNNLLFELAKSAYTDWYNQKVKEHLTPEQKESVVKRISDMTLWEGAIWDDRETNYIFRFPELEPYCSKGNERITGLQLVAVMEAIFHELHPEVQLP